MARTFGLVSGGSGPLTIHVYLRLSIPIHPLSGTPDGRAPRLHFSATHPSKVLHLPLRRKESVSNRYPYVGVRLILRRMPSYDDFAAGHRQVDTNVKKSSPVLMLMGPIYDDSTGYYVVIESIYFLDAPANYAFNGR